MFTCFFLEKNFNYEILFFLIFHEIFRLSLKKKLIQVINAEPNQNEYSLF
jgi:hypothetical protein